MGITLQEVSENRIYTFWQIIPLVKKMNDEKFTQLKQETRQKIIEILRTGIEDTSSENNKRYALTANEIQSKLTTDGSKTSLQNTYFHLKVLLDEGFITEIAILKDGRFNKRYYGRTAKLFLFTGIEKIDRKAGESKKKFIELIRMVNTEAEQHSLEKIIDEFIHEKTQFFLDIENKILTWFERNADIFIKKNLDVKETYEIVFDFILNGDQTPLNKKMLSLLKII